MLVLNNSLIFNYLNNRGGVKADTLDSIGGLAAVEVSPYTAEKASGTGPKGRVPDAFF